MKKFFAILFILAFCLISLIYSNLSASVSTSVKGVSDNGVVLKFKGAETVASNSNFNLNLHMLCNDSNLNISKAKVEINYDKDKLEFVSSSIKATRKSGGKLFYTIPIKELYKDSTFRNYSERILTLKFASKDTAYEGSIALIKIQDANFYDNKDREVSSLSLNGFDEARVSITPNLKDDINKDGLISIGDIGASALKFPIDKMKSIAEKSIVYEYKRVVYIGFDGAGIAYKSKSPYYGKFTRENYKTPVMDKFLKEGTVSFDAKACMPSASGNNWTSILHSYNTLDVDEKYQVGNNVAGSSYYYEEENKYKSFLKIARETMANRRVAAFTNWSPITDGIIEKSIGAETLNKGDEGLVKEIKKYIEVGKAKNTSVLFIVFDDIDHTGHTKGWYVDSFYEEISKQDKYLLEITEALKKQNLLEDTLIIVNSDHGGLGKNHGGGSEDERTVFIGVNGRTVNKGKIITGGENRDVPFIVSKALNFSYDANWQGRLFSDEIFLSQKDVSEEKRDVEGVRINNNNVIIENIKNSNLNSFDLTFDLKNQGSNIDIKEVKGVSILYKNINNNKLRVVGYTKRFFDNDSIILNLSSIGNYNVKIEKAIFANEEGNEIYANIL